MYRWSPFPFVRIVLLLATGILFSLHFESNFTVLISVFPVLLIAFVLLHRYFKKGVFGFNALIPFALIFILGILRTEVQKPSHDPHHLLNQTIKSSHYLVKLNSYPVEKEAYFMFNARIIAGNQQDSVHQVSGNISLYIRKDSSLIHLPQYGDVLSIHKSPFLIAAPKNPHEFNYQQYMSYQQVYHQVFLSAGDFQLIKNEPDNIFLAVSFQLRTHFKTQIEKFVKDDGSRAIAYALLLGIKDDLSTDLKRAYSAAGAMHVLAVSGLHVGIIFLLISSLFAFLKFVKGGKYWLLAINLFFLWGYAFVTGLSPSVLRAVVMFSVIIIGKTSDRYANIYNNLAVSALIILLYDPYMILKVGFQLSYLAVLGIVYLQPRLYQLITVKNYLLDKAWGITCVSIAAQIATFPLGLYYFHQFPTYFLVSNLIVIPAAFVILLEGIFLIVFSPLSSFVAGLVGALLNFSIQMLNEVVIYINNLTYSLIDWVNIDFKQTILIYFLILSVILLLHYRKSVYLKLTYLCISLLTMDLGYRWFLNAQNEQIVFYELKDNAAIDFISGRRATLYLTNTSDDLELLQFQIGPNRLANDLPPVASNNINLLSTPLLEGMELISWKNKRLLVINQSIDVGKLEGNIRCDFLVISNDAEVQLKKLLTHVSCVELIIDSSNSYYHGRKLATEAADVELPFHFIRRDGAYIVDL